MIKFSQLFWCILHIKKVHIFWCDLSTVRSGIICAWNPAEQLQYIDHRRKLKNSTTHIHIYRIHIYTWDQRKAGNSTTYTHTRKLQFPLFSSAIFRNPLAHRRNVPRPLLPTRWPTSDVFRLLPSLPIVSTRIPKYCSVKIWNAQAGMPNNRKSHFCSLCLLPCHLQKIQNSETVIWFGGFLCSGCRQSIGLGFCWDGVGKVLGCPRLGFVLFSSSRIHKVKLTTSQNWSWPGV